MTTDPEERPARGPAPGRGRVIAVVATIVLAVAVAGIVLLLRPSGATPPPATSTDAAAWVLPRLDGPGTVSLAQFRGRPVVVDFFASWCDQCRTELPYFATISSQLHGTVTFVGVDSLETGDGMAMARQFHIDSWPLARDVGGISESGLHDAISGSQGMPVTAFYDASGKLVYHHVGGYTEADLRAELRRLYGVG